MLTVVIKYENRLDHIDKCNALMPLGRYRLLGKTTGKTIEATDLVVQFIYDRYDLARVMRVNYKLGSCSYKHVFMFMLPGCPVGQSADVVNNHVRR